MNDLLRKIDSKAVKVGVIGMGYVGLPLAMEIAKANIFVSGIDISIPKVEQLNQGISYIGDVTSEELAEQIRSDRLKATTEFNVVRDLDVIIICVPTPLGKTKDPDLSMVMAAVERIAENQRPGQLVVLESTTYPGTTEELVLPRLQESGLQVGKDFFLAFSPERVDPGNPVYQTHNTPKVIGGVTPQCLEVASRLYRHFILRIVPVSSCQAAEMVKLLENTFRSVNIGLVNEVALMCDRLGVDVWEVIDAAGTKPFGFMPFQPGPGLGGHCIPIDPLYLSWKLKTLDYRARFIELASEINADMPRYVVNKVNDALNDFSKSVKNSRILVVGVSYKKDIDDLRESPALDVIQLLQKRGAKVVYHDPFVAEIRLDNTTLLSSDLELALRSTDCTVIVTNHSRLNYQRIVDLSPVVLDTRNATKGIVSPKIIKL
ncbi:MAG TPA: nucleotide sugar dehydrogenase [Terriglobia bacterium]|nr:nucleotide sugar dehydrogenase [Terriglobia bacterium]